MRQRHKFVVSPVVVLVKYYGSLLVVLRVAIKYFFQQRRHLFRNHDLVTQNDSDLCF